MAIATGALVAAGVMAAGSAYSAHKQSSSNKDALKYQEKANKSAMDWEKEQAAKTEAQFLKQQAAQQAQWDAWQSNRRDLLRRYGVNVPEPQTGGVPPQRQTLRDLTGVPPVGGNAGLPPGGAPPAGAVPMDPTSPVPPMMGAPRRSLKDWNDWSRYAPIS